MLLAPWFLAILFILADEIIVGRILRFEYAHHRAEWESDGKPRGVFWIPKEARIGWYVTYASGHAAARARWRWLFSTPDWASEETSTRTLVRLHRIFLSAFVLSAATPFILAMLLTH